VTPIAYLDCAASMPVRQEAVAEMTRVLTELPGNPSGAHFAARAARRVLDDARDVLSEVLGAGPGDIVFTGGGTEADNLAVLGAQAARGGTVVVSAVEHPAVRDPAAGLDGLVAPVGCSGRIDLDALAALLEAADDVALVSVMLVNNEVGTIQPIAEVADVVRRLAPDAVLHTDAVQALSWVDVAEAAAGADLISVSAHKFGGPKGVGALVVRPGVKVAARQIGGGQERDRRSGTQNVAGVAAMATAARLTADRRPEDTERIAGLRDRLADGLLAAVPDAVETGITDGDRSGRAAGLAHLCFPGVEAEALLFLLDQAGLAASAASSCASGAAEPSPVLAAMGVPRDQATGSLRLSLGWASTAADVDRALEAVPAAVARLRAAR
jgi:cysteine desulfurase